MKQKDREKEMGGRERVSEQTRKNIPTQVVEVGPGRSQESSAPSGSPMLVPETQVLEPALLLFRHNGRMLHGEQ